MRNYLVIFLGTSVDEPDTSALPAAAHTLSTFDTKRSCDAISFGIFEQFFNDAAL